MVGKWVDRLSFPAYHTTPLFRNLMLGIDTWLRYAWQAAGLELTAGDGAEIIYI